MRNGVPQCASNAAFPIQVSIRLLAVICMALSLSVLAGSVALMLYSVTEDLAHPLKLSPLYSLLCEPLISVANGR